jgi:hypothetical protein
MGFFKLMGEWSLELEDGTHQVQAEIKSGLLAHLTITWDGGVLYHAPIFIVIGELRRFQQNGHTFVLGHRGYGMLGQFVLSMDGKELGASPAAGIAGPQHLATAALEYVKGIRAPAEAAVPGPQSSTASPIQFVKELSCTESDEVVGEEEYPLDNRFGSSPFSTDRQVSKETTNELSVDVTTGVSGSLNAQIITAIKAEVAAQFTRQTGQRVGERVTESQTLHFTVAQNQAVVYQVVWKRKVRSGEHLYMANGAPLTVPYRVNYGLSCEVRTQELPRPA